MNRKISVKLQLINIALIVTIILSTVAISYISYIRHLESQVISSNLNVLSQIGKRVDSMLQEIDLTMLTFLRGSESLSFFDSPASNSPQSLMGISALQDRLGSILGANFNMKSVMLYAKNSGKLVTPADYYSLKDAPQMSWVQLFSGPVAKFDKWTALPPGNDGGAIGSDFLMVRSYPFPAGTVDSKGIAVTRINERSISRMFEDLQFNDSYNVFLVDRNGTIMSHKDPELIHQSIRDKSYSEKILAQQGQGYVVDNTDHGRILVFYNHSSYTGWTLIYVVSRQQLGTLSFIIRNILIGAACLLAVLAIAVTRFVNKQWFVPIENFVAKLDDLVSRSHPVPGNHRTASSFSYSDLQNRIQQVFIGYSDAERRLHESLPALKLQIMFEMLTGKRTKFETAEPLLKHVGIGLHPANYIALTAEFDHRSVQSSGDLHLYLYALCNVAEESIGSLHDGDVVKGAAVQINDYQAVILLSFACDRPANNAGLALIFAERLRTNTEHLFKKTISIGVGSPYPGFKDIRTSYLESVAFVAYKILTGPNAIITSEQAGSWDSGKMTEVFETVDGVLEAIKQADAGRTNLKLDALFDNVAATNLTKDMMVQLCLQVLLKALRIAADSSLDERFQEDKDTVLDRFQHCETMQEMQAVLGGQLNGLITALIEKRSTRKKSNDLIEAIQAYLTVHYVNSDISVNYMADLFGISPNYLSKLFKEHTTMNFIDYLIEMRMKAASSLLLETPLKLNEIALQTGYANFSSFLRNFKKYYGMTPTEFRQVYTDSIAKFDSSKL
ncbi:helix-turn-helix domain-containing protein [Paenibacillus oryzisoli]|uniref:helix-turn-helix domain-containing protein n=1 Tax=Paenibacillus oryzisoli TaxID=1850517 RepID=UPI003D267CF6